jgi:DNA-directed RNA polymerase subunit delta
VGKKRIIKSYEQLSEDMVERLKEKYPDGYEDRTITFTNPRGEIEVAIPFETEEIYYLIKLPRTKAAEEEEEVESSTFDEFDNFESLEISDEVQEDEE